jgi:hypothetical protein
MRANCHTQLKDYEAVLSDVKAAISAGANSEGRVFFWLRDKSTGIVYSYAQKCHIPAINELPGKLFFIYFYAQKFDLKDAVFIRFIVIISFIEIDCKI